MWACYIGEISESYQKQWEPHTVSPDQKEPDVYDVIDDRWEIGYRLDMRAAQECLSDCIQVDWGGWAILFVVVLIFLFLFIALRRRGNRGV